MGFGVTRLLPHPLCNNSNNHSHTSNMNTANIFVPKDPAFKLFGRQIPLPHSPIPPKDICSGLTNLKTEVSFGEDNSRESNKSFGQGKEDNSTHIQVNKAQISSKPGEDGAEATCSEQEKLLKKPDKVVPCPRCNSLETKFCYFNNYNVNQPRHFCKNCQRYWTAGGTMRNVPIGAGRRKNKHLASQYRQILVSSDGVPITRMENSDSANHQFMSSVESAATSGPSTGNGVVLKFGPEAPLCESMENALNIGEQNQFVEMRGNCPDNGEEPSSCISSLTSSSVRANEMTENVVQKEQVCLPGPSNEPNVTNSLRCYPAPSLVFPWNPTWNHVASMAAAQYSSGQPCAVVNGNAQNQVQWCSRPVMAVPSFCPPNIPVQLVPAPYWGCMPMWTGGAGNVSFSASNGCLSPSSSTSTSCCSGNGSPTLGKHCRDTIFMEEERAEKKMLVPKTLRIDDQSEGSRGPLLAKLGLKPDLKDLTSKGTVFKIYETKGEGKDHVSDATYILEANPAALSRSHTFQEST